MDSLKRRETDVEKQNSQNRIQSQTTTLSNRITLLKEQIKKQSVLKVWWALLAWFLVVGKVWITPRKYEQEITQERGKFYIDDVCLDEIISQNNLKLDAKLLYSIHQNEIKNKTQDRRGIIWTEINEFLYNLHGWYAGIKNSSFGTFQSQNWAFINTLNQLFKVETEDQRGNKRPSEIVEEAQKEADIQKRKWITRLAQLQFQGKSVLEECGYDESELDSFIEDILAWNYNISDGDGTLTRGNGVLGFSMSLVMLEMMSSHRGFKNVSAARFSNNPAQKYLQSPNYRSGYINGMRPTNYPRAKEATPKQARQNLDIVLAFLQNKVNFSEINRSLTKSNIPDYKNADTRTTILSLDLPDGDPQGKFSSNAEKLNTLLWEELINQNIDHKVALIRNILKSLDEEKKVQVAKLMANLSYEHFYLPLLYLEDKGLLKDSKLTKEEQSIVNRFSTFEMKEKELDNLIDKKINSKDSQNMLDAYLNFLLELTSISLNEKIWLITPVLQKKWDWKTNDTNTIRRFEDGFYDQNAEYEETPFEETTWLIEGEEANTESERVEKLGIANKQNLLLYRRTIVEGDKARSYIDHKDIRAYLIKNHALDTDRQPISEKTFQDKNSFAKIPEQTIAQFLSYDPTHYKAISPQELSKLKVGQMIYIIKPKTDKPIPTYFEKDQLLAWGEEVDYQLYSISGNFLSQGKGKQLKFPYPGIYTVIARDKNGNIAETQHTVLHSSKQ